MLALQKHAQAALEAIKIRAISLDTILIRLQGFHIDTLVATSTTPIPTVAAVLARLDTQLRQDAIWCVNELQRVIDGAASAELGFAVGGGVSEWKRDRFGNAASELEEADSLKGELVGGFERGEVSEGEKEVSLEEWEGESGASDGDGRA